MQIEFTAFLGMLFTAAALAAVFVAASSPFCCKVKGKS